ncbi:MAG: prophage regulatory protein [Cyclobacteriaceae bacterium]|jgi:prophage regulatory protein
MKQKEKEYLLYYLEQLSLKLRNNISEMQQGLNHIAEISKNISQEIPTPQKVITFDPMSTDKLAEKPPECLIRIKEVCLLVSVGRTTIYRMVEEGSFPKPLNLGPRFKAWQKKTVIDWIVSHDES